MWTIHCSAAVGEVVVAECPACDSCVDSGCG